MQERLVREAARVVGLYHDGPPGRLLPRGRRPSASRTSTSPTSTSSPSIAGRGLGVELVAEMVERGPYADRAWLLHTGDAHELYRKFGFGKPGPKLMERASRGVRRRIGPRSLPSGASTDP